MANKGTQALLKSDISLIKDIVEGKVSISVSTTDVEGVMRLNPSLDAVFPPMVDIPYERADSFARKLGFSRGSWRYKAFAFSSLIFMFIQMLLSVFSAMFVKIGLRPFYRADFLGHVKNCGVVISYSDENFKETASMLPLNIYWMATWWTMLISRSWDVLIAKFLDKPVVMFPNSVGPFRTFLGRFMSRLALNSCDLILVREPVSYRIVESLHVKTPKILTFDTTWLFKSTSNSIFKDDSRPRLGVSPGIYSHVFSEREIWEHVTSYAKALDEAVENFGFSVVFLPHYISGFQYDDLAISKMMVEKMKNKNQAVIIRVERVEEFKSFLDKMDMVISSKMHPAVLALSGHVPTLCIAYDHKQTGLFEGLDMNDCVILLNELSGRRLFSKICYVWNNRERIKAMLEERIPSIRKNIRETIGYALSQFGQVDALKRASKKQ